MKTTLRRVAPELYRTNAVKTFWHDGLFGQIRRRGRKWEAEIRRATGEMLRPAGSWRTRKDAHKEINSILDSI